MRSIWKLLRDEDGANLVEWGILVSLIAVIAIVAITSVGVQNSEMFSEIASSFP